MSLHLTRSRILAVGTLAFVGGVFFASSMDLSLIHISEPTRPY